MWFILLINIHRWKFTLVSTSIPSAHHSASNTAKSATKYLPKGGISQYASNLLLLSKTNPLSRKVTYSNIPILLRCHHPLGSLCWRVQTGWSRPNMRRGSILSLFPNFQLLLLILLLLPTSCAWKMNGGNRRRFKVKSAVQSTLSTLCPGPSLGPCEGPQLIQNRSNAQRRTLSIFSYWPVFWCNCRNSARIIKLYVHCRKMQNILRKYIQYYKYKQGLLYVLK